MTLDVILAILFTLLKISCKYFIFLLSAQPLREEYMLELLDLSVAAGTEQLIMIDA